MAELEDKEEQATEEARAPSSGKKKGIALGGGVLGVVAAAYALFLMAVPGSVNDTPLQGPFLVDFSEINLQVNLSGDGGKAFLVMTLKAEVFSYDETYPSARVLDPLFQAKLKDSLIGTATRKTRDEINDPVGREIFKHEIRGAIDPVLFPVHVGNEEEPEGGHEDSGLRPGDSIRQATLRSGFHANTLRLDVAAGTVALNAGEAVAFQGTEADLQVVDEDGDTVYLNVTELDPEFKGTINVGTLGRVQGILFDSLIVQ